VANTPFMDRALPLVARGFSLIPLSQKSKDPAIVDGRIIGPRSRTKDLETLEYWSAQNPDGNVGLCCDDNFVILESDDEPRLRELLGNEGVIIPETFTSQARENRPHWIFRRTERTNHCPTLPGLFECRFVNQYVVGPGSIHPKTGQPYCIVRDVDPVPFPDELMDALEHLSRTSARVFVKVADDGSTVFGEGDGRQQLLCSQAGRIWRGQDEEEFFNELQAFNLKRCNPPKEDHKVRGIVEHFISKRKPIEQSLPVKLNLKGSPRHRAGFVLAPIHKYDGLFPFGQPSLVYGASGAGKSTIVLQMLDAILRGESFWDHRTAPCSILWLQQDRGIEALFQTMERMGLPKTLFPHLPPLETTGNDAVVELTDIIQARRPEIFIVDGLDLLAPSLKDAGVKALLTPLQKVLAHHGTALIGLWGAPKRMSSPKEAYKGPRDAAGGSALVGRMCATMLYCREDYETHERIFHTEHRNAKPEEHTMRFNDEGRLVEGIKVKLSDGPGRRDAVTFLRAHGFQWNDLQEVKAVSERTWYRRGDANVAE
jgi:Bifunctional DNA primase/polymerase, N-terminal/AAA domain